MIKKILILFISAIPFISCNNGPKKNDCGTAWIGGKIVNPKLDYVVISHNRNVIDTIPLQQDDTFLYKVENADAGIYFLTHFEYQALFVEPGDSILAYVNTIEFDESLTYTGKGAEKNNFLMDLYLLNEQLDDKMPGFYNLSPKDFELKMDSVVATRNELFEEFNKKTTTSKKYKEVAKVAIDYGIYSKKELYITANSKKMLYDESIEIPADFYDFRKHIDYGNEALRNYYPYFRYLGYYLDNLAFDKYKSEQAFDRFSYRHNLHKIQLIDSLITNDSLKNNLMRSSVIRYLLNGENAEEEQKILDTFKGLDNNPADIREVEELALATMKLAPGNSVPNVMLLTTDNTLKDLHSILKKPTVLFFWSDQSVKQYKKIHARAAELREKYPEYDFIGINVDNHFKKWLRIVSTSGYKTSYEFQFDNFDDAEMKLLVNSPNKSMIVDKEGVILDGNTNIFSMAIEEQLLGYLNQ
ncbi:MAG: hypothetical protein R2793_00680 [Flavobacteriaceae bacterium]